MYRTATRHAHGSQQLVSEELVTVVCYWLLVHGKFAQVVYGTAHRLMGRLKVSPRRGSTDAAAYVVREHQIPTAFTL